MCSHSKHIKAELTESQPTSQPLYGNLESKMVLDRCAADTERPLVQAQTSKPSKALKLSPLTEKTRYSMTKPDLNRFTYLTTQPYRKYCK